MRRRPAKNRRTKTKTTIRAFGQWLSALEVVDRRIAAGAEPTSEALANELGIDHKSALGLFDYLRELGAPIALTQRGYVYIDKWDLAVALRNWTGVGILPVNRRQIAD